MDSLYNMGGNLRALPSKKKKQGSATTWVIPVLGLLALGLGTFGALRVLKARKMTQQAADSGMTTTLDPQTAIERQLSTFAGQFLMNYYNYSYTIYTDAVKRAEDQMTPELQAVYQVKALDRDFITMLNDKQVSTDGFRIIPNSIRFGHTGKTHYVQLSGEMTYTTEVNGAQAEWPMTVLLEIFETDQGFKVNNVQRQR